MRLPQGNVSARPKRDAGRACREISPPAFRALRKATCPTGGRSGIRAEQAILGAWTLVV